MKIYFLYYLCIFALYWATGHLVFFFRGVPLFTQELAYSGRRQQSEKWFLGLSFGLLILLLGLRHPDMGVDLVAYLPAMDVIANASWRQIFSYGLYYVYQNFELGYVLLNKLISVLGGSHQILLFMCGFLSLYPIARMCMKYSKDTLFSLIIYLGLPCFLICFSGLRQAIGIAVTVYSYQFIREKKLLLFCATIFLATLFHSTAYIFLLAYPLYHVRLDRYAAMASVLVLPVVWLARVPLFLAFSRLFKESAEMDHNNSVTLLLVFALIYGFCVFFGDRENRQVNGLSNLFFVACCIQTLGGVNATVIRVGYYFMIYLCLLLPEVLTGLHSENIVIRRNHQLISYGICFCFVAFGLFSLRQSGWAETNPYSFFWVAP